MCFFFLFSIAVNESHIVVQALRLNTMSKLTFADCARFDALVKDVFPGIDFKDVDYDELCKALHEVFEEANLEIISSQVNIAAMLIIILGILSVTGLICFVYKDIKGKIFLN